MQADQSWRASFRRGVTVLAVLAVCVMAAACGSGSSESKQTKSSTVAGGQAAAGTRGASATRAANLSPIKLGVMADLASTTAIEGAEMRINTDLAVQTVNAAGGINGHPLQVTYVDTKADPSEAVRGAQQLVQQDHVDVLVGAVLSSECLGVEDLAPKLGVVYVASTGCATNDFTGKQCNKYSFRIQPVGSMTAGALAKYMVQTYGKRWAIVYPDYAFGQSQLAAYTAALEQAGGTITTKIAIPLGEANVTPYVSKIPVDGSVDGLINSEVGTDLARVTAVMEQFGIGKKLPIVGAGGKERFGGVYPDALTGSIFAQGHLSDPQPDNKFDQDYVKAFKAQAAKEGNLADALGGADKATPGELGYQAWGAIMALKNAMIASKFTGRADTDKLIAALENLNLPQGPDFPAGPFIMNKSDHQGRYQLYILKINGQTEEILQTIPPDQIPLIGNCKAQ
jgi:ABC-type branched-subunit amino acid transport system substrate-binding protein